MFNFIWQGQKNVTDEFWFSQNFTALTGIFTQSSNSNYIKWHVNQI